MRKCKVKKYFKLLKGYDPQRGGLNDLNKVLNEFGIKFSVSHDTLYVDVDEENLEKYRKKPDNIGRPRKEFDFKYVEAQKEMGKTNKEIYEALGISKALFYKKMNEKERCVEYEVKKISH